MPSPLVEIEPRNIIHPDTVGLYPFMYTGDIENSGDRLQAVANELGIPIIASDLLEQKRRTIFDLKARDALRPGANFIDTCKRQAERIMPKIEGFGNRLGIGHSLGGVAICGMQRYAEEEPFTCVELCDSFNIDGRGYLDYVAYRLRDVMHSRISSPSSIIEEITQNDWSSHSDGKDENTILSKILNVGELMKSAESKIGALTLAANAELPMHVIGYKNGLAGSASSMSKFLQELKSTRIFASQHSVSPAKLLTTEQDGWHSDLLKPNKTVPHLKNTLELLRIPAV